MSPSAEFSRGRQSEKRAALFLQNKGWQILALDQEIFHVQVDLLARDPHGLLHVVEVKSQGSLERGILSVRQRERLLRVVEVLGQKEEVTLSVVVIDGPKVWVFGGEDL